jgi:hypothetical protein
MTRGRKPFIKDRVSTTVSIGREDLEELHKRGIEISELFRKSVKTALKDIATPLEKLRIEVEEKEELIRKETEELERMKARVIELEEEEEIQKSRQFQLEEFENEKELIFLNKYKRLILHGALCEVDFYHKARKDFRFNDPFEAKDWLFNHYMIRDIGDRQFTEERVKTFLRWDKDLSKYW